MKSLDSGFCRNDANVTRDDLFVTLSETGSFNLRRVSKKSTGAVENFPHGPLKTQKTVGQDVTHGLAILAYASDLVA
jgi:hypothetical protein